MTSPAPDPAAAPIPAPGGPIEASVFSFLQHRIRDVIFVLEVTPPERYRFV